MLTKPRDVKQETSLYTKKARKRVSPLLLIGVGVTVLAVAVGAVLFATQQSGASHAAGDPNVNCTLIVPDNPLSAQGLATPYQLTATDPAQGPCNEANTAQSAFVQAAILDPVKGTISAYEPLVIDKGTQPAVKPVVPQLPRFAVVGIWFGFNATILSLKNNARTHGHGGRFHFNFNFFGGRNGNCVNGTPGSPFGQFAYCNAQNFFRAANLDIRFGKIKVPELGTANDGQPCMTTRDFAMVDMDQSDNVQTQYLVTANGQTAQLSAANKAQLQNATVIGNPSDNALLTAFLDPALGCTPWTVPDLVNPGTNVATFATDELMAAADQKAPVALIPAGDEMVLVNGNPNLQKVNLYRAGADQPPARSLNAASTTTYCQNLVKVALPRLQLDMANFQNQASPDAGAANSLFTFLANRLNGALGDGGLNCTALLNIQNPITLTTDGNGVVTAATINTNPTATNAAATTPAAATPAQNTGNTNNTNNNATNNTNATTPAGNNNATNTTTPAGNNNTNTTTPAGNNNTNANNTNGTGN